MPVSPRSRITAAACGLVLSIGSLAWLAAPPTSSAPDASGPGAAAAITANWPFVYVPAATVVPFTQSGGVTIGAAPSALSRLGGSSGRGEPPMAGAITGSLAGVVDYAFAGLGHHYVWGGTSPVWGWDCSGFVQWAYAHVGINLPRTEQWTVMTETTTPSPGDLVVQNPDGPGHWSHVGIYIGNGKMISAYNPDRGTILHSATDNPTSRYFTLQLPGQTPEAGLPDFSVAWPAPSAPVWVDRTTARSASAAPRASAVRGSTTASASVPGPAPVPSSILRAATGQTSTSGSKPGSSREPAAPTAPAPTVPAPSETAVPTDPAVPAPTETAEPTGEPTSAPTETAVPTDPLDQAPTETAGPTGEPTSAPTGPTTSSPGPELITSPATDANGAARATIADTAQRLVGSAVGEDDLLNQALAAAGIFGFEDTTAFPSHGSRIAADAATAGDLVYYLDPDGHRHIAIYAGDRTVIRSSLEGIVDAVSAASLTDARYLRVIMP